MLDHELDVAIAAARDAVGVVNEVYAHPFDVDYKERNEPVTIADRRANEIICNAIACAFPNDAIVAEESAPSDPARIAADLARERVWLVDPLDGTKEFVARNDEFAVMIGLCVAGTPIVGVVALPMTGQVFVGGPGGAWLIAPDGARRPLHVSSVRAVADSTLLLSRSHRSDRLLALVARLAPARQVISGSVGIKCARIAASEADVYINLPSLRGARLWDACGPEAIVRAAGGRVSTVFGEPIAYQGPGLALARGMVATNGWLHDEVLAVMRAAPAAR